MTRARLALATKMVAATVLVATFLMSLDYPWLSLSLAFTFIILTVLLDYWVYRAVDRLFQRLRQSNDGTREPSAADDLHTGLEQLMETLLDRFSDVETLEVETVRSDLYRLRGFNNQLLRLGDMARELSSALPYRETKRKVLDLTRHLLSADLVVLVSEEGGRLTLEGVAGCEEGEINLDCCSFYARCPVKSAIRNQSTAATTDHACSMFSPTMRSQLALSFTLDDGRVRALLAASAGPTAFEDTHPVVLQNLIGQVRAALAGAQKHDRIRREVVTDPLTNLYNRRFFQKRAEEEIARSLRHQQPVSLLMIDVDHFKRINDQYGHQTGDRVLQTVAKFLQDSVRQSDVCGRYGGEEFVLLLPGTPGRNAVYLADRLRRGVEEIMFTGLGVDQSVKVTVSGGVATCPRDATSYEELLARADEALYEAKHSGRNQIVQAGIPDPPYSPDEQPQEAGSARRSV
ncbi:MAG: hypothetical protein Kow00129_13130 [Thermoleophilia bacterium]